MLVHIDREGKLTLSREIQQAIGVMRGDALEITIKDNIVQLKPYGNNQASTNEEE